MSTTLVLTSSALGGGSVSNQLVEEAIAHLRERAPSGTVITRDLDSSPVPHLVADTVAAFGGEPANGNQAAARALSDELLDELIRADTVIIGSPMYNFGIASTLKAWFDHVLRAGVTFRYTEAGSEGLLKGKRAVVVVTRGGFYSEGEGRVADFQEPHIRTLLQFMGITDISFVRAERLAFGPEAKAQAIEAARADVARTMSLDGQHAA